MHSLGLADPHVQASTELGTILDVPSLFELGAEHVPSHTQTLELGATDVPSLNVAHKLRTVFTPSHEELGANGKPSELGTSDFPSQNTANGVLSQYNDEAEQVTSSATDSLVSLDPEVTPFVAALHATQEQYYQDLVVDLEQVRRVQDGGVGNMSSTTQYSWKSKIKGLGLDTCTSIEKALPLADVDDIPALLGLAPKQIQKVGVLQDLVVKLPGGDFCDKILPTSQHHLQVNDVFTADYFVALHNVTSAQGMRADGSSYEAFTSNHLGARISLPHTKLRLDRWRHHLIGYGSVEICQFLEFGFPIGTDPEQELECKFRNHGSSYMWYSHVDKFIAKELTECGVTGPFSLSPWKSIVISPLMTAHKKPMSRRTVFDATYGDWSVNNATPGDQYLGQPTAYTYPKVEDYRLLILKEGRGCFMWKRDLSRFFLQLPMDPVDYSKVGMIWRGLIFFFVALAFGLRHSGLNGQRVTDAVAWILRRLGLDTDDEKPYNVENYVDDMGGVESALARAESAFATLGWLLKDLGLDESKDKAESPSTTMTYLGIEFDSMAMEMRVPADKLQEIKSEIRIWLRRTTITKKELQSLLGKLFWISKVVKHSRVFLGRMLEQLRSMSDLKDNKKTKLLEETRKDLQWWAAFLEHYNGVQIITIEDPIKLSYQQLLESPNKICAGDATPTGGGAWHGYEFWCGPLPHALQDPQFPIPEFWALIVSAKLWGDTWTGRPIALYCDNDAVCEVIWNKKPREQC